MDRLTARDYLSQAERHVSEAEQHIARHRALLAKLNQQGEDDHYARGLLHQMQVAQELQIADRDRLRAELESAG